MSGGEANARTHPLERRTHEPQAPEEAAEPVLHGRDPGALAALVHEQLPVDVLRRVGQGVLDPRSIGRRGQGLEQQEEGEKEGACGEDHNLPCVAFTRFYANYPQSSGQDFLTSELFCFGDFQLS